MIINDVTISTIRSGKGDCIHLRYNGHNVIVDSGPTSSAGEFRKLCESILKTGQKLDALIITHYDDDHIGGVLRTGDLGFRNIYFNAYDGIAENSNLSAVQNQRLFHALPESKVHSQVLDGDVIKIGGANLIVQGPTPCIISRAKEQMKAADAQLRYVSDWIFTLDELMDMAYPNPDTSLSNQSSIIFTFEYEESRFLFTGDAWSVSVPGGTFNLAKLPHHGSIHNISDDMIRRLDTDTFLICTDGISHPNKQTVAKLLKQKDRIIIYSNYEWWMKGFLKPEDMKYIVDGRLEFRLT